MNWRKASHSANGEACVEVATWRKSSYSNGGEATCVEVRTADGVFIRDTTDRGGVTLSVPAAAWTTFLATLR